MYIAPQDLPFRGSDLAVIREASDSHKFKGKTCAYYGVEGISETADHVIARELLPAAHRDGIPKVATCGPCNNAKSPLLDAGRQRLGTKPPFPSVMPDGSFRG